MADLTNPIMTAAQSDGTTTYRGRFGANAADVQVQGNSFVNDNSRTYQWSGSLQDYIDSLDDYFSNSSFMYCGINGNIENLPKQVKFWYNTNPYYITQQPKDYYINTIGDPFSFTVEINDPQATYQWQYSEDSGRTWGDTGLSNNRTATLGPVNSRADRISRLYRCKINLQNNTITYSNTVHVILS